jgi:hypothetical protein
MAAVEEPLEYGVVGHGETYATVAATDIENDAGGEGGGILRCLAGGLAFVERDRLDGGAWQREHSRWEMRA